MAQAQVIDEDQLGGLAEAAGADAVRAILEAYWESTETLSTELVAAAEAADASNIAQLGHALKGSSANIGAALMALRAQAIEVAAKAGDVAAVREAVSAIPDDIERTRHAIDNLLARVG